MRKMVNTIRITPDVNKSTSPEVQGDVLGIGGTHCPYGHRVSTELHRPEASCYGPLVTGSVTLVTTCGSHVSLSHCLYYPWTSLPNLVQRRHGRRFLLCPPSFQPPSSLTPTRFLCLAVKALDVPELLGPDHLLRQQDASGSTLEDC